MEMHHDGNIISSTINNVINVIYCLYLKVYQKILIKLNCILKKAYTQILEQSKQDRWKKLNLSFH